MLLIDGLTITVVGMLAVFAFLGVLVLSMALLKWVVDRLPGPAEPAATGAVSTTGSARPGAQGRTTGGPFGGRRHGSGGRMGARRGKAAERAAVAAAVAAYHAHRKDTAS